ncbi:BBE domain-containing protein, partial [Streptomyces sp. URMC 123]|uniref:BBE domain-containing protein n=1 Tax=Streptomyces sp. URMC 123 TaxID=3423403 RepID=UPI003F193124
GKPRGPAGEGRRDGAVGVHLTALGGAIGRVPPGATAFVHRGCSALLQYLGHWPRSGSGRAHTAWLGAVHRAMRPHVSGAAYQNYADPWLTDWRRAYYGGAAHRLARLKRRYDPERLFDFPQAL